jgi:zona occludens toxin (predicted ATPase)
MNPLIHRYAVYGSPEPECLDVDPADAHTAMPREWRWCKTGNSNAHIGLLDECAMINTPTTQPIFLRMLRNVYPKV